MSDHESLNEFRENISGIVMFSDIHLNYSIIKKIGKGGGSEVLKKIYFRAFTVQYKWGLDRNMVWSR